MIAQDFKGYRLSRRSLSQGAVEIVNVRYDLLVNGDNEVSLPHAGLAGGPSGIYGNDLDGAFWLQVV